MWPESLWVSDCIPQGFRVSLVWYQLLTCHLSGRAAKEKVLVLWTVWTDWRPCCVLKLSQITHPADSCSVKLGGGCKDVHFQKYAAALSYNLLLPLHGFQHSTTGKTVVKLLAKSCCCEFHMHIHTGVCVCMYTGCWSNKTYNSWSVTIYLSRWESDSSGCAWQVLLKCTLFLDNNKKRKVDAYLDSSAASCWHPMCRFASGHAASRSRALTVKFHMFEARSFGKRIFLLRDDISRDLIFKQQPREMLTVFWKWASEDIFRSTCNLSNKPEAKHTRAWEWCLHWRANCAWSACEERQSAPSRAWLDESQ